MNYEKLTGVFQNPVVHLVGESQTLEYKRERPRDSHKYLKTVVAFANGGGGTLTFGVDDKTREAIGIPEGQIFTEIDAIANAICDGCEPAIRPEVTIRSVLGKQLIEVRIGSGVQPPYYIKSMGIPSGVFVRVGATTHTVEPYAIREMLLRGSSRSFDSVILEDQVLEESEVNTVCRMLTAQAQTWHDLKKRTGFGAQFDM